METRGTHIEARAWVGGDIGKIDRECYSRSNRLVALNVPLRCLIYHPFLSLPLPRSVHHYLPENPSLSKLLV